MTAGILMACGMVIYYILVTGGVSVYGVEMKFISMPRARASAAPWTLAGETGE